MTKVDELLASSSAGRRSPWWKSQPCQMVYFVVGAFLLATLLANLTGCTSGTSTKGVVKIGPDLYMIGGLGRFTDFSGSAVKARLYQQADEFCKAQGRVMVPVSSTAKDSEPAQYASAEIQFLCLAPDDPRAK